MPDQKISALTAVTTPAASDELPCNQAGNSRKLTSKQILQTFTKQLASSVNSSSTTPAKVTGLDFTLPAGTYKFEYWLIHQAAAATTGIRFDVNHSGTVTRFVWNQRFVDVSATAATAAQDQDAVLATASVMAAFASRAKGTAGRGTTLSVDTINADMLTIIEGICVVTGSGDLQLYHGSEVAAQTTLMAGSSLIVTPIL